ncbi:DNA polymerase III subunit delta [Filifactor alocis]
MTYKEQKNKATTPDKYILYGEEEFLMEDFVNFIRKKLNPAFSEFNFITISQETTDYLDAISKIESVPMMDVQKVIYFPEFMTRNTAKNLWSKKEMEQFVQRVENLSKDTWLIMKIAPEDRKNTIYQSLKTICQCLDLKKLTDRELYSYIQYQLNQKKAPLSETMIKQFIKQSGYLGKLSNKTLYDVNSDLDKVVSFLLQKKEIDEHILEQLMSPSDSGTIFDLENYIFTGNVKESFKLYEILELQNKNPEFQLSLLGILSKKIAVYMKSSYLLNQGYSQGKIAKELNVKPFYLTKALSLKKRYSYQESLTILNELNNIDYRYKTGEISIYRLVELTILTVSKAKQKH